MPLDRTLAVLGTGMMGGALVRGWVRAGVLAPDRVFLSDAVPAAAERLAEEIGARAASARDAVAQADLVLVAVKPPIVADALSAVRTSLRPDALILSVAAGISLAALEAHAGDGIAVIRTMPNTPALVGAGAAALCRGRFVTDAQLADALTLFSAVGEAVVVEEKQMDAVTGVSGSGPAYFYLLIEALADGGVKAGLPRDTARRLAAQTALGAAKMVLETGEHPAQLKDKVTTPAGTTIAGLAVLERHSVRAALIDAVEAAANRSKELS